MRSSALLLVALIACAPVAGPATTVPPSSVVYPIMATSDMAVGRERVLVALYEGDARSIAAPDRPVELVFHSPAGTAPVAVPAEFLWTIPDEQGVYKAMVSFEVPGEWAVTVRAEGLEDPVLDAFLVREEASTPQVGEPAPPSDSLTLDGAELADISTDPEPDPSLYAMSIAEAVHSGRPSVIVFATPRFCTSRVCGPTLDLVKQQTTRYPDTNFVHVEVYDLTGTPEDLTPVSAVEEWGLPSEPWVFTVDAGGTVTGRFEGTISEDELAAALGRR